MLVARKITNNCLTKKSLIKIYYIQFYHVYHYHLTFQRRALNKCISRHTFWTPAHWYVIYHVTNCVA